MLIVVLCKTIKLQRVNSRYIILIARRCRRIITFFYFSRKSNFKIQYVIILIVYLVSWYPTKRDLDDSIRCDRIKIRLKYNTLNVTLFYQKNNVFYIENFWLFLLIYYTLQLIYFNVVFRYLTNIQYTQPSCMKYEAAQLIARNDRNFPNRLIIWIMMDK